MFFLQAFRELAELQATISGAVRRRYTETAQWFWNEILVNSMQHDFSFDFIFAYTTKLCQRAKLPHWKKADISTEETLTANRGPNPVLAVRLVFY